MSASGKDPQALLDAVSSVTTSWRQIARRRDTDSAVLTNARLRVLEAALDALLKAEDDERVEQMQRRHERLMRREGIKASDNRAFFAGAASRPRADADAVVDRISGAPRNPEDR